MKSYDELKARVKTILEQMAEAKKNEITADSKKVKELCKEFGFTAWMLKNVAFVNHNKSNLDPLL